MTTFRLATATVLLAGLALPALAQGTPTPAPAPPATSMTAPASPARVPATAAASPMAPTSPPAAPTASASVLPHRAMAAAPEDHAERTHAERVARSHHRFASATRMERERAPHTQGEVAPAAIR